MPDFRLQPNFPVASVIDAAQRNNALQEQAREAGRQSLVEGLKSIGQVGQSLYEQKFRMAQALSGAKMFAQTPEGQQMLGTNPVAAGPGGQTVTPNQTASFSPDTGAVTPNQSPVKMNDLQTAMYGESPSNMLTQLFERQKQRQQFGLEQQKQAFTEKMKPLELAQQERLTTALTGVKSAQVSVEEKNNIRNQIAALETRKNAASAKFPELAGTFVSGLLPKGSNAQQEAALKDYQDAQRGIDTYNQQLYGGAQGGGKGKFGVTLGTPGGLTYTINKSE